MVGQDALKTALLLIAVDPLLGGLLIRGPKGTGKSTAARSLRGLFPELEVVEGCPFNSPLEAPFGDAETARFGFPPAAAPKAARRFTPFIELPLNATEDRLAGTLEVEQTLATGRRQFEPGLLAAANRGVLYVDEVNLLDDHLVDLLLDAAASGVNVIEREGLSFVHPARFLLIGTMNPEEGELRPQFLDRFGLCVSLDRLDDPEDRQTLLRRRLAFDRDPEAFIRDWADAERQITAQLLEARAQLDHVQVPDSLLSRVAELANALEVAGHRADLTLVQAARAHAAFLEKRETGLYDLRAIARLALAHRVAASPLDAPADLQRKIEKVLGRCSGEALFPSSDSVWTEARPEAVSAVDDLEEMAEEIQVPGGCAAGSILLSFLKKKHLTPSAKPTTT